MLHTKGLRAVYLFTVVAAFCFLITGCPEQECTVDCPQPEDVECTVLSKPARESTTVCTDGNEPQVCMARESDHCGYIINAMYVPCRACDDCDTATNLAVALCLGTSLSVESSFADQVLEDSVVETTEALRETMEYLR